MTSSLIREARRRRQQYKDFQRKNRYKSPAEIERVRLANQKAERDRLAAIEREKQQGLF